MYNQVTIQEYNNTLKSAFTQHYSEHSDDWTDDIQMRVIPALIQGQLKLPFATRVLDIGCGAGRDALYFAKMFQSVLGIDLCVHEAWSEISDYFANIEFLDTDFLSFYSLKLFDLILDNGCFHHQDPTVYADYLKRAAALLSTEGIMVLSTFKDQKSEMRVDDNGRLHKYFSDDELYDLLEEAGLLVFDELDLYRMQKNNFYRVTFAKLAEMK